MIVQIDTEDPEIVMRIARVLHGFTDDRLLVPESCNMCVDVLRQAREVLDSLD